MNLKINSPDFSIAVLIMAVLILFYIYYYFAHSSQLKRYFEKREKYTHIKKEVLYFLTKKISGFLIMGILAGILYGLFWNPSFEQFGLHFNHLIANLSTISILVAVIFIITFTNQFSNPQQSLVQMNIKEWNWVLFLIDAAGWSIYLIGYEFLFRGILLIECYNSFGFWPAVAVNVAIYSAIHMVNGKNQAIGALIFGTIACFCTLSRGTILIPVFMHIALSISADFFSIRMNKNLRFVRSEGFKILQR